MSNFDLRGGPYGHYQPDAMVGQKADVLQDNVSTFTCDVAWMGFGLVLTWTEPNSLKVRPGGPVAGYRGISLRDHLHHGAYERFSAVSVLTRGRVWAHVADPAGIMDGVPASYRTATGEVATTGTPIPNAVFRSIAVGLPDEVRVAFGFGGELMYGAIVEIHHPRV